MRTAAAAGALQETPAAGREIENTALLSQHYSSPCAVDSALAYKAAAQRSARRCSARHAPVGAVLVCGFENHAAGLGVVRVQQAFVPHPALELQGMAARGASEHRGQSIEVELVVYSKILVGFHGLPQSKMQSSAVQSGLSCTLNTNNIVALVPAL